MAYHFYEEYEKCAKHFHKYSDEINLVIDGAGQVSDDYGTYIVNKGDIFVVPRGHAIQFTSIKKTTRMIVIKTASIKGDKYYV